MGEFIEGKLEGLGGTERRGVFGGEMGGVS